MMRDVIAQFPSQFRFQPKIEYAEKLAPSSACVVLGLGGSQLYADLVALLDPTVDLIAHRDYGLPARSDDDLKKRLFIASSYSGNTEEVLDGMEMALRRGYKVAAITVGGKLLARAQELAIPYVQVPDTGIQPRAATGFMLRALFALLSRGGLLGETAALADVLDVARASHDGDTLAAQLRGKIPVMYASEKNGPIARIWKIKFNENAKIPAFWNVFPELNHNEMTGFDRTETTRAISNQFHFIFLRDADDHPRNRKRMDTTAQLYHDRGLAVSDVSLFGATVAEKIFSSLLLADCASVALAEHYRVEPEQVPMVEEFKKLIA